MELTSPFQQLIKQDAYLLINNTICCFNCREFCKAEHKTFSDWLVPLISVFFYCQNCFFYKYKQQIKLYHRHRRKHQVNRNSHFEIIHNSVSNNNNLLENHKYFYFNSIKTKFKIEIQKIIVKSLNFLLA